MNLNRRNDNDGVDTAKLVEAWNLLQAAIRSAPIPELQEHIVGAKGFRLSRNFLFSIRDEVTDAFAWATLGDEDAIKELTHIGNRIAIFLAAISRSAGAATLTERPQVDESSDETDSPDTCSWFEDLNRAVDDLMCFPAKSLREAFAQQISSLPEAPFRFPLNLLSKGPNLPDRNYIVEVSDLRYQQGLITISKLCDGLIQKRFLTERLGAVRQLAARSKSWPVAISANDYHRKKKITDLFPVLKLGSSLAVQFNQRKDESPGEMALWLFEVLERERTSPCSTEEKDRLNSPDVLERADELDKRLLDFRPFNKAEREEYIWNQDTSTLRFHVGAIPFEWHLGSHWRRKAALLPPLSKGTVQIWMEAGFAYLAFDCDGDLRLLTNFKSVARATGNTGGVIAGIRRVLTRGFDKIAKEDK